MIRWRNFAVLGLMLVWLASGAHAEEDSGPAAEGKRCGEGKACAAHLVCEIDPGFCEPIAIGTCVVRPELCTQDYRPVCDCAGRTHPNDCARLQAGVQKRHDGECEADAAP